NSSRLAGKVLKQINGLPMLYYMLQRVGKATKVERVILATSNERSDDVIADFCESQDVQCFRGQLDDVLDRYYQAAKFSKSDHIVRLTADCPIIDPSVIDKMIEVYKKGNYDYIANTCPPEGITYPEGMDVEIFSFKALERAWKETKKPSDREHVTFYFWQNPEKFSVFRHDLSEDLSQYRLTVDYPEDFEVIKDILNHFLPDNLMFTLEQTLSYLDQNPKIKSKNENIEAFSGWQSAFEKDKEFLK
ncbi:MAG: NTP transferase domain-containing protein, partial [Bacteroidetes bacterium]|nr:NTP transferase domain-containing protein [Bacteroidota bacterium]